MSRMEPHTDLSHNYQVLDENLKVVRERLNRPMTLSEKILYSHLDNPKTQVFLIWIIIIIVLFIAIMSIF
jgi:aconitate hydratase